jgi:hypothetical protein
MGVDGAGQHLAFDIAADRDIVVCGLRMGDAGRVLLDDRAFVEIGGDVMRRGADQLDAALIGLLVGVGALELGRKEWWMLMIRPDIFLHIASDSTCM